MVSIKLNSQLNPTSICFLPEDIIPSFQNPVTFYKHTTFLFFYQISSWLVTDLKFIRDSVQTFVTFFISLFAPTSPHITYQVFPFNFVLVPFPISLLFII